MKRIRYLLLIITLLVNVQFFSLAEPLEVQVVSDREILFRNIAWGTSFSEVESQNSLLGLYSEGGEFYDVKSVENILNSDIYGYTDKYEFKDIRIYGHTSNGIVNVAGFTTTDIDLFFARVPVDGILTKSDDNTALYGARYSFENVNNLESMETELIRKLTELYGEPGTKRTSKGWTGNVFNYTYWYGTNDTAVCIRSIHSTEVDDDDLYISYVWLKGDDLLQAANDSEASRIEANNREVDKLIQDNTNNYDGL